MVEEILSQSEIDALLSALTSGEMDADELKKEEEEKRVRVYDFKRALRFSKDQIRSIGRIHENYARLLTTFFSTHLRSYVDITVASVDQIPYEEFIRSVPELTVLNVYSVEPLEGNIIMEVNPNIAYSLIDRILGGQGSSLSKISGFTEIETVLLTQLFEKATGNLNESWSSLIEVEAVLEDFEVNPQFLQMVAPNETVVVVSLNATIGETKGMINICIPHIVLEPIIPKLSFRHQLQTNKTVRDPQSYEDISKHLHKADVEAKAILGETSINIEQFLNLQIDDVIALNQPIDEPLPLEINNAVKYYVQPGTFKNKYSVQILYDLKEGDEQDG